MSGQALEFFKGSECALKEGEELKVHIRQIRAELTNAMSAKNLSFLLGAGCSSLKNDGMQVGVPTMKEMASEYAKLLKNETVKAERPITEKFCADIREPHLNLERLLERLFAAQVLPSQHSGEPLLNSLGKSQRWQLVLSTLKRRLRLLKGIWRNRLLSFLIFQNRLSTQCVGRFLQTTA